jgi:hypothetical protein
LPAVLGSVTVRFSVTALADADTAQNPPIWKVLVVPSVRIGPPHGSGWRVSIRRQGMTVKKSLDELSGAAWVTANVFPATVALPVLTTPVFSVHETVADPGPVPLAGETLIHDPFPDAVQFPPMQLTGRPVIVTS